MIPLKKQQHIFTYDDEMIVESAPKDPLTL